MVFTAAEIFGSVGIGLIVVPFSSLLKKEHWDARLKVIIAILVSVVFSIGGLAAVGKLHNVNDVVTNAALVFSSATAFYKLYFSYTNVESLLSSIGSKRVKSVVADVAAVTDQAAVAVAAVPSVDTAKLTAAVQAAAAALPADGTNTAAPVGTTDANVNTTLTASNTVTKANVAESGPQPNTDPPTV